MVLGEVQSPSVAPVQPGPFPRRTTSAQSGGFTRQADRSQIVRGACKWPRGKPGTVIGLSGSGGEPIRAGDTVVVPFDTERLPTLPLWQSVTQILYNIAIAVAAVHSL